MPNLQTILVATDFGECSRRAVQAAAAVAVAVHAEVRVLHVVEDGAYAYPFPMPSGVLEAAKARLDEEVARLRPVVAGVSGLVREGFAAQEIAAAAAAVSADLVVVGSHGRSGLPRFVHGSVAESVVRQATTAVLTVHPSDEVALPGEGGRLFRRLVAPTDLGDASHHGLDVALDFAQRLGATVTLVHVCELPRYAPYVTDDMVAEVGARARRDLDAQLASARRRVPTAEAVLRRGNPWTEILSVVKERGADLVVLATHGRRLMPRALIGSVADKLVRLAPVPVLTVPSA